MSFRTAKRAMGAINILKVSSTRRYDVSYVSIFHSCSLYLESHTCRFGGCWSFVEFSSSRRQGCDRKWGGCLPAVVGLRAQ